MLSFFYRSLPEPLMTYELHGEFIIPASKYLTVVQIEVFPYSTVVAVGACANAVSGKKKILNLVKIQE